MERMGWSRDIGVFVGRGDWLWFDGDGVRSRMKRVGGEYRWRRGDGWRWWS